MTRVIELEEPIALDEERRDNIRAAIVVLVGIIALIIFSSLMIAGSGASSGGAEPRPTPASLSVGFDQSV